MHCWRGWKTLTSATWKNLSAVPPVFTITNMPKEIENLICHIVHAISQRRDEDDEIRCKLMVSLPRLVLSAMSITLGNSAGAWLRARPGTPGRELNHGEYTFPVCRLLGLGRPNPPLLRTFRRMEKLRRSSACCLGNPGPSAAVRCKWARSNSPPARAGRPAALQPW